MKFYLYKLKEELLKKGDITKFLLWGIPELFLIVVGILIANGISGHIYFKSKTGKRPNSPFNGL